MAKKNFSIQRGQTIIVVAKNITVLQLFISRMPKMCAIPQLVSVPLNPILVSEAFLWQSELKLFACCTEGVGQNTVIMLHKDTLAVISIKLITYLKVASLLHPIILFLWS